MEGFAEYSSDSDGASMEMEEGQEFQPPPAWQQDDDDDDKEEEEETENKDRGEGRDASETSKDLEEAESAQKKRRLLPNPLDALSNATTSFLAAREEQEKEEELEDGKVAEPASGSNKKREESEDKPVEAPPTAPTDAPALSRKEIFDKKKESTRQKNTRKQKFGQANFTIKDNRECPSMWNPK
uniref:Uncharacterized protein n=1 Tax=Guillardia theta TaxID=55529 RepID=A0A7S4N567_GUITH|mmetsp:Transcript_16980/g.56228  ORF Transcript_16980/g.56228 Transcript_16980/m.56228 type:complete len:184 (+) Transcript_16980:17-568(+)